MDQEKYKQIRANSWKQAKTTLIVVGVILLILAGMAVLGSSGSSTDSVSEDQPTQQTQTQVKSLYQYEVLSKRENNTVENVDVLVTSGETNGQSIALEVKKTC
jgi:flagellar basal body-associated protein FliL